MKAAKTDGPGAGGLTAINRYVNGAYVGQFPGPYTRTYDYKHTQGENTPGYFSLIKSGKLVPMTSFVQWEVHGMHHPAECDIVQYGNPATRTQWTASAGGATPNPEGTWLITQPELSDKYNSVIGETTYYVQAAAAKIYSQSFDGLTFIAELHQTVALFRNLVSRISDAVASSRIDNLWLEGRYGWRQIWLDMKSIQNLLNSIDDSRKRHSEKSGATRRETAVTKSTVQNDGNRDFTRLDTTSWEVGLRGSVVADIDLPKIAFNPLTTGWEVLRLSFVIDWLVNIGQLLESFSFLALESEYTSAAGVYVKATRTTDYTLGAFNNGWAGTYDRGGGECVGSMSVRTPASVSLLPQIKLRLNEFKVLDLVALLTQAIFRRK